MTVLHDQLLIRCRCGGIQPALNSTSDLCSSVSVIETLLMLGISGLSIWTRMEMTLNLHPITPVDVSRQFG